MLAQHEAREIVLVKASELDPLRKATDASDLAPPVLVALAVVLLGLGALTARSAGGALAATFVCLLGACAGVLVAFLAARDQALESSQVAAGGHDHHVDVRHGPATARASWSAAPA